MSLCAILSKFQKVNRKNIFAMLTVLLFAGVVTNASAITPQEVIENALKVYENIDNYKAIVRTYETDSMEASGRIFESQQPIIAFNLFFRKPDEHAVKQIRKSRHGIFRVELLSTLAHLKHKTLNLKEREFLLGHNCYVLAATSPDEPGTVIKLWISPKNWTVQQFTLVIESLALANTQFKYPPGGKKRVRFLPMETRSFFPISKKVLINRITDYQLNTSLPSQIFEASTDTEQSK